MENYNLFCQINEDIFKQLIYDYVVNDNEGQKLYMPKYSNGPSNSFVCPNFVGRNNTLGLIQDVGVDLGNLLIDFKNLMYVIHKFYFLDDKNGENYDMKYGLFSKGVFKIYVKTKDDLMKNEDGVRVPWDQYDLVSINTPKKKFTPIGYNDEINDYYWKSYFKPIFHTNYIDPKTKKRVIFSRNKEGYRFNHKYGHNFSVDWFPKKAKEDVEMLCDSIKNVFDKKLDSSSKSKMKNYGYKFSYLNKIRCKSKAYFIAFLKMNREGKMSSKNINFSLIEEYINNEVLKYKINDLYDEKDWENNPDGLNIDECISYEINKFLTEEVKQLEIPFDFNDDGRSKVNTYQKGYHRVNRGEVEWLSREVKKKNLSAIIRTAELLSTKVNAVEPVFIPIPNHEGYAYYTLKICQILANKCKGQCCDILSGDIRDTLYSMKKNGIDPKMANINFRIKNGAMFDDSMFDRVIYLVDNVLDSGTTFEAAKQVIQHIFGDDADIRLLTLATTNKSGNRYNIQ